MFGFDNAINDVLGGIGEPTITIDVVPITPATNEHFEDFKQWVVGYVQEHDGLDPHHQTLQQIPNMASTDELEQILRHNHEYCDDCFLKMYRKFASGEESENACPCGGE